jgi:Carboxypeptidase regulatory-like domain
MFTSMQSLAIVGCAIGFAIAPPKPDTLAISGRCLVLHDAESTTELPIVGATVVIDGPREAEHAALRRRVTVTTDSEGRFTARDLARVGEYSFTLRHPEFHCSRSAIEAPDPPRAAVVRTCWPADQARESEIFRSSSELHGEVILRAAPGAAIAGVIREPDGTPIAGAAVVAGGGGDHHSLDTKSDDEGRYRISGLRRGSSTIVSIRAAGFRSSSARLRLDDENEEARAKHDVTLTRGGVVRGVLPESLRGATVRAVQESGFSADEREARVGADGSFVVDTLEPGARYRIVARTGDGKDVEGAWFLASVKGVVVELR